MNIEDLLLPRYKVIAPWPGRDSELYTIGDILTDNGETAVLNQNGDAVFVYDWPKYPHLFTPLHWSENRKKEDLPMYLRDDERIWKLKDWRLTFFEQPFPINEVDKYGETEMYCSIAWHFRKDKMLPATAEEYNNYKAKKDGTVNG